MATEIVEPYRRNDRCWCDSEKKYKACHGRGPASHPGAPVPKDDGLGYWVSPTVYIEKGALGTPKDRPVPVMLHPPGSPGVAPLFVAEFGIAIAEAVESSPSTIADLGRLRLEVYHDYGLDEVVSLEPQLAALSDEALTEIGDELCAIAGATIKTLETNAQRALPRTTLWTDAEQVQSMIGQTLFWADHYLVDDDVLNAFLGSSEPNRSTIANAISRDLGLASLYKLGTVAAVPTMAVLAIAGDRIQQATAQHLANPDLLVWLERQLILEGPTAREVLLVSARDDITDGFYTHSQNKFDDDDSGRFVSRLLQPYDPQFDYGPWIDTVKSQFMSRLVQEANIRSGVAELFRGEYVTSVPFRARLLDRIERARDPERPSAGRVIASIEVPWMSSLDPADIARLAGEEEAVDHLRRSVSKALKNSNDVSTSQAALRELVTELEEDAAGPLARKLSADKFWKGKLSGGLLAGSILLGTASGPLGFAGAALAAASYASQSFADRRHARSTASFIFWSARRRNY